MSAIGGVFDMSGSRPHCIGSCSAFGSASKFVTAAHVVAGRNQNHLAVNHFGHQTQQFSPIKNILVNEQLDSALLDVVVEEPKWIEPFTGTTGAVGYGSTIVSIGWPMDLLAPDANLETLRCFRGYIQRAFFYTHPGHKPYSAYELSFAAPPGLSGAPVFLANDPKTLIGIVTENFSTHSLIEATEEVDDMSGSIKRIEYRTVITYGVAVNAWYVWHSFENQLSGVSLSVMRE